MSEINFREIDKRIQENWERDKIFEVKEDSKKEKFYCLDMFPYPSGAGLHMGHAFVYTLGDIFARFKRLQGYNVLYPIGYDSLGLPAENAAIKTNTHPEDYTTKSIANFMKQQKAMGWSYDWSRVLKTSDENFYKWDQWIFLQMLKKGIAYRKKAPVNYCPKCETVLANEQVVNGKCWRHEDIDVEIKHLEQWFFNITKYTEDLLKGLEKLDWPERAKVLQRNWIGKSFGTEVIFNINGEDWKVFTTRPDTLYGVTFLVISAQHNRLFDLVTKEQKLKVEEFLKKLKSVSEKELEDMEKEGIFTGSYAINPLTNEKVPVYAGNFVLADYASGMVMAVPAHDQRDYEFAKKYNIEIKQVIQGEIKDKAYTQEGVLINSKEFNGLKNIEAKNKITEHLEKIGKGKKTVQYKLRDWLVSRQRYWGTPIPIVYCEKCGIVPLEEKNLPVKLPKDVKFGQGNPLKTNDLWITTTCPKCNGKAKRETDTMDTFVNSSWYFLRYCDSKNFEKIFDSSKTNYWCPINQYIGGPEHITMHLIYIRFYTKFLKDLGIINFDEPALKYFTQGIVKGSDGEKMSKSKGNVIEPLETIEKYGADALRFYLVSNASADKDVLWSENGMVSTHKFISKLYSFFNELKFGTDSEKLLHKLNKTLKEYFEDVENFKYNLAIIKLRALFEFIQTEKNISKESVIKYLQMLHVFCPHITEDLYAKYGFKGYISLSEFPKIDESKINLFFDNQEMFLDKLSEDLSSILKVIQDKSENKITKAFIYVIPNELEYLKDISEIETKLSLKIKIFAVNDKDKYDPENKSQKSKPGKPAIHLE
jgi:leucyl-tRNA synthetase